METTSWWMLDARLVSCPESNQKWRPNAEMRLAGSLCQSIVGSFNLISRLLSLRSGPESISHWPKGEKAYLTNLSAEQGPYNLSPTPFYNRDLVTCIYSHFGSSPHLLLDSDQLTEWDASNFAKSLLWTSFNPLEIRLLASQFDVSICIPLARLLA
jgi:hypothetical protein